MLGDVAPRAVMWREVFKFLPGARLAASLMNIDLGLTDPSMLCLRFTLPRA
jgi:hypothetical protein